MKRSLGTVSATTAGGLLNGKYDRGAPAPSDSRYGQTFTWPFGKVVLNERVFDAVDQFGAIAREKGVPPSQLALAWCMQQPGITSPIMGPRTLAQLEENLAACTIEIAAEELQRIDAIFPPGTRMEPPVTIAALAPGPHPPPRHPMRNPPAKAQRSDAAASLNQTT